MYIQTHRSTRKVVSSRNPGKEPEVDEEVDEGVDEEVVEGEAEVAAEDVSSVAGYTVISLLF
jgi:hypothetical protein